MSACTPHGSSIPASLVSLIIFVLVLTSLPGISVQQAAVCQNATSMICDAGVLACCDSNFRSQLQITTNCSGAAVYENPSCMGWVVMEKSWNNGLDGVMQVCRAFNLFRDCLAPSTRSCTTYEWYLENFYQPSVASSTQGIYHALTFLCGAGLDAWLHNFQCMEDTFDQSWPTLVNCWHEFESNVQGDPGDECDYLKKLTGCFEKNLLPCGEETGWWACEIVRLQVALGFHQCSSFCTASKKLN